VREEDGVVGSGEGKEGMDGMVLEMYVCTCSEIKNKIK
jgi:hypothetical protein